MKSSTLQSLATIFAAAATYMLSGQAHAQGEAEPPAFRPLDAVVTATPASISTTSLTAAQPEFTITSANFGEHTAHLTPGMIALLQTYPETFRMQVYPTVRTARFPEWYVQRSQTSKRIEYHPSGAGLRLTADNPPGLPFLEPQNGLEAIYNHLYRYTGGSQSKKIVQIAPASNGEYTPITFDVQILNKIHSSSFGAGTVEANIAYKRKEEITSPSRLTGTALLIYEPIDDIKFPRQAWTYNTGQRRVRRAPNLAFDAPGTASDGLRADDDHDMFSGTPNKYNWSLDGVTEIYTPYNTTDLYNEGSLDKIIQPGHLNPALIRYERRPVARVTATLKDGLKHIYTRRIYYMDLDSWQILTAELYDNQGELFRVAVAHPILFNTVPVLTSMAEVHHDLSARRYVVSGLIGSDAGVNFEPQFTDRDFTPAALRREGLQ
ncbi:MAG: DUF1329 domain-containing protein [Pseudomonadota bacterium]